MNLVPDEIGSLRGVALNRAPTFSKDHPTLEEIDNAEKERRRVDCCEECTWYRKQGIAL